MGGPGCGLVRGRRGACGAPVDLLRSSEKAHYRYVVFNNTTFWVSVLAYLERYCPLGLHADICRLLQVWHHRGWGLSEQFQIVAAGPASAWWVSGLTLASAMEFMTMYSAWPRSGHFQTSGCGFFLVFFWRALLAVRDAPPDARTYTASGGRGNQLAHWCHLSWNGRTSLW